MCDYSEGVLGKVGGKCAYQVRCLPHTLELFSIPQCCQGTPALSQTSTHAIFKLLVCQGYLLLFETYDKLVYYSCNLPQDYRIPLLPPLCHGYLLLFETHDKLVCLWEEAMWGWNNYGGNNNHHLHRGYSNSRPGRLEDQHFTKPERCPPGLEVFGPLSASACSLH